MRSMAVRKKHRRPVAVVVSAKDDKEREVLKLVQLRGEIELGLQDIRDGRTVDGRKVIAALRAGLT